MLEGRIDRRRHARRSRSAARVSRTATVSLIQRELKGKYDFRRAKAGHRYRITQNAKGALVSFHYTVSATEHYWLENDRASPGTPGAKKPTCAASRRRSPASSRRSLHDAIEDLGGAENARLANDFAGIFAWDLDFSRGIQQGDQFRILYERTFAPQGKGRERNLGPGRILAAHYHGGGGELQAIYFETEPGRGGYYRPDGTSVQGAVPGRAAQLQPHHVGVLARALPPDPAQVRARIRASTTRRRSARRSGRSRTASSATPAG